MVAETILGNVLIVASFAYLVSAIVRLIESRYKPQPEDERKKRIDVLYGRDGGKVGK